jgi:predicted transglutaminase-like cysteine proteinase
MKRIILIFAVFTTFTGCNFSDITGLINPETEYEKTEKTTDSQTTKGTAYQSIDSWETYCERYNVENITYPQKTISELNRIFYELFNKFNYVSDLSQWGEDQWDILDDNYQGDCEDFSITLQKKLIENGFEQYNVMLAIGTVTNGNTTNGHMALIVKVNLGERYICDNTGIYRFDDFDMDITHKQDESGLFWAKY